MTRRKKPWCSVHDNADVMYRLSVRDKREEPRSDELASALGQFVTVLNEISPSPLEAALDELTPENVRSLLHGTPVDDRRHVLRPLRIPLAAPKTVSLALSQNVLRQLRTAHLHDAQHASLLLTNGIYHELIAAEASAHEADGSRETTSPGALLRLSLWSCPLVGEYFADVITWASSQSWWLSPGFPPDAFNAVLAAARAVIDASPHEESEPLMPENEMFGEDRADGDLSLTPGSVDEFRGDREELNQRQEAALTALREAESSVEAGRPVTLEKLDAVKGYTLLIQDLAERMTMLTGPVAASLEGIDEAIARAEELLSASSRLELTGRLRHLCGPHADEIADLVDTAIEEGQHDSPLVTALIALGELVDAFSGDNVSATAPEPFLDLETRVSGGFPPPLNKLVPMTVFLRQLRWASAEDHPGGDSESEKEDNEPSPPTAVSVPAAQSSETPSPSVLSDEAALPDVFQRADDQAAPNDEVQQTEPEPEAIVEQHSHGEAPESVIADLIAEQRFALAAEINDVSGGSPARSNTLRIAALADAVRSETGSCAARLHDFLLDLNIDADVNSQMDLPLLVSALVRTALVTGDMNAGALLSSLTSHLDSNLQQVADQVGRRAMQSLLTGNPLRSVLLDVAELEFRVQSASAEAQEHLRARRMKFKRASEIVARWHEPNGVLGTLLTAAADDDRTRLDEIASSVKRLSGTAAADKEIDILDRKLRAHSNGKPMQGSVRIGLRDLFVNDLATVSRWLETIASIDQANETGATWATGELSEMRDALLECAGAVLGSLEDRANSEHGIGSACTRAARASLDTTFKLLANTASLSAEEPPAHWVLTGELLKVPGSQVNEVTGNVTPQADVTETDLLAAASLNWASAFAQLIQAERYEAARYLRDLTDAGIDLGSPLPDGAFGQLKTAESNSRRQLRAICDALTADLRTARQQSEVSDEQDGELTSILEASDLENRHDLAAVRTQLAEVSVLLPRYRAEAAQKLRDWLDRIRENAPIRGDEGHITRLIDDGALSTAEELIHFCEIGEAVPEPRPALREDFSRFFPAVPDALPRGLTDEVIEAARQGTVVSGCPALDYSELSEDVREFVSDALLRWRAAGSAAPNNPSRSDSQLVLRPALRLAGFEFAVGQNTRFISLDLPKGRDRRFIEVTPVWPGGDAVVPAFGSKLSGYLHVLQVWGQQPENLVINWADQDISADAILVVYFGTLSAAARRRLASRAAKTGAAVAVLDDAALAYLAARGGRQLHTTMSILLPTSVAVQPYSRRKRSAVAPEMFYGRDRERSAVIRPEDTQIIYGGRGLGKSALLRTAKAEFERRDNCVAIHIELTTTDFRKDGQSADAVWDVLRRDLTDAEVLGQRTTARRTAGSAFDAVRSGVLEWIREEPRRKLLIMLDESDGFFEADAPRFLETNRLKELGQASDDRVKVVFAGLHSVQRFAKVSNNTFKHLALRPTVIGPLQPQFAYDLIDRPTAALGFRFENPDLVTRILTYCSYQPFLLQMFGHRLIERMYAKRAAGVAVDGPPFVITREEVEAIEADPELKADITSTFRDTLHLDDRYNVIANVLAHHAQEHGLENRLNNTQLREECKEYWRSGFDSLDFEAFRAYLQEMVGLGLLAQNNDGQGWHLRSPNVLRMIGSKDEVIGQLIHAESEAAPREAVARAIRRPLPGSTNRSPLTTEQVNDLLGDHANQVRVVLGSDATGVSNVAAALRAVRDDLGDRYELIRPKNRKLFEDALITGEPGRRRLILSDLVTKTAKSDPCNEAVSLALDRRPDVPGVTRSVVIVAGPDHLPFWEWALNHVEQPELGIVTLHRYNWHTLRVWALDSDTGQFLADDRRERLFEVTGGWPYLVDKAAELAVRISSEERVLRTLEEQLSSDGGPREHLSAVGLLAHPDIWKAYHAIASFAGTAEMPYADLIETIDAYTDHADPAAAVATLDALGVFEKGSDGGYCLEPLTERCWTTAAPSLQRGDRPITA